MAHVLTLCKNGVITINAIQVLKKFDKPIMFIKAFNRTSGKKLTKDTAFSFASWGFKIMEYLSKKS